MMKANLSPLLCWIEHNSDELPCHLLYNRNRHREKAERVELDAHLKLFISINFFSILKELNNDNKKVIILRTPI